MKSKFYSKDLSQILRRALSTALCLFLVWDSFTLVDAANVSVDDAKIIANQGYTWTWIKGPEQLYKYSWKSVIEYDTSEGGVRGYTVAANNGQKGSAYAQGYYDNDETHWTRAMILYTSGNNEWYMNAGSSMVDDGEIFSGKKVMSTYNIKPKEETFTTRKGYDTWFIKYAGEDSDNKSPMLYFRFSSQGNVLGSDILAMNASWYGVKNHAAIYSELRKTNANNPSSRKHNCFACSSSLIEAATLDFHSNGSLEIYYNVPGTFDRYWHHDNSSPWEIESTEFDYETSEFDYYLYLGTPVRNSIVPTRDVLPQTTAVYLDVVIDAGTIITVKEGAYMAFGGKSINNGKIVVDGGTLVVFGGVDTDTSGDVSVVNGVVPGSLEVKNGGVVIIEETATYLMRYSSSTQSASLSVTDGSLITCNGTLVVPGDVTINNSRAEFRPGSVFIHNFIPNANTAGDAFAREALWDIHQNTVKSNASYLSNYGEGAFPSTLKVENNASLYVYGLCYQNSDRSRYSVDATSYADYVAHTNINSKIVDMVRQW